MKNIYLYGAGGHRRVILDILHENGITVEEIFINIGESTFLKGIPVTHNPPKFPLILSFGDNAARKSIATEKALTANSYRLKAKKNVCGHFMCIK